MENLPRTRPHCLGLWASSSVHTWLRPLGDAPLAVAPLTKLPRLRPTGLGPGDLASWRDYLPRRNSFGFSAPVFALGPWLPTVFSWRQPHRGAPPRLDGPPSALATQPWLLGGGFSGKLPWLRPISIGPGPHLIGVALSVSASQLRPLGGFPRALALWWSSLGFGRGAPLASAPRRRTLGLGPQASASCLGYLGGTSHGLVTLGTMCFIWGMRLLKCFCGGL